MRIREVTFLGPNIIMGLLYFGVRAILRDLMQLKMPLLKALKKVISCSKSTSFINNKHRKYLRYKWHITFNSMGACSNSKLSYFNQ
jgi:hypothetical protein